MVSNRTKTDTYRFSQKILVYSATLVAYNSHPTRQVLTQIFIRKCISNDPLADTPTILSKLNILGLTLGWYDKTYGERPKTLLCSSLWPYPKGSVYQFHVIEIVF